MGTIKARARESSRRPQKSSRKTTPRSTHGVSQWYHQIARAPLVRLFGATFRDGRALCGVDENDPPKTTRKTTTPLVRERRDEECKHRGEGGEGRNGCIKNDYYGLPRRKGAEDE